MNINDLKRAELKAIISGLNEKSSLSNTNTLNEREIALKRSEKALNESYNRLRERILDNE